MSPSVKEILCLFPKRIFIWEMNVEQFSWMLSSCILFVLSPAQKPSVTVFKCFVFSASLAQLLTPPLFQRLFPKPGPASLPSPHLFCAFISRTMDSDMCVFAHSCTPQTCNWCALRDLADTPTPSCWGQNQLEQELLCSPGSDSVCLNHCWRQMSLTMGTEQPVSSGPRNSQADAGEVALLRVCPFGAVDVNHNGKLERPVCWIW